jgi:hypothetical protein
MKITRHIVLFLSLCSLFACNPGGGRGRMNRRVTFGHKDKIPYGAYIAYENLPHLFPNAEISINRASFSTLAESGKRKQAYIFIGHRAEFSPAGINGLLNFVGQGNHVFLSALHFSDTLLHTLNIRPGILSDVMPGDMDSLSVSVLQPQTGDSLSFAYPGASNDNWIDSLDTQYATVLGKDVKGRPNLVKFSYKGGGTLFLHFAPMAFTNFFLLHKNNKEYYDNVFSYIPGDVNAVLWDENYFHNEDSARPHSSFSTLGYIWRVETLRFALLLLLLLLLVIYLFESKRRQRIVPVIEGLRNNSLDFVTTIGRLYYQRRDNRNLISKMAVHFLDHIRTKYNLSLHLSDEGLADRLSWKTGISKEFLHVLIGDLLRLQDGYAVSDEELLALNRKLEEFYKQA